MLVHLLYNCICRVHTSNFSSICTLHATYSSWNLTLLVPMLTEFTYSKCLYMHTYSTHWSTTLCTTYIPDVELEVSLLVEGVFLLGVSVLPADVGVDVITWVVSVGPFTVRGTCRRHQTSHPHPHATCVLFILNLTLPMLTVCTYCVCAYTLHTLNIV